MVFDTKAFLLEVFLMFLGFGMRSFWKKIPGELFILIGFTGIIATLSYGKFYTINVVKNPYFLLFSFSSTILIFSILLRSYQSSTKETTKKMPDVFNAINIETLKGKAFLWGSSFENLKNIILFRIPFQQYSRLKYALFFKFNTSIPEGRGSKGTFDGHTWSDEKYPLKEDFKEVYKEKPIDDFLKEWLVTTEPKEDLHKNISLILYNKKDT
ncbi:MAG: hypothetical protein JRJ11_03010 [Deltaproteobacteria bacterium]|nr:hypothetical protein [Deltaproteobacteria bacterium]